MKGFENGFMWDEVSGVARSRVRKVGGDEGLMGGAKKMKEGV